MGSGEKLISCSRQRKVWVGKGTQRVTRQAVCQGNATSGASLHGFKPLPGMLVVSVPRSLLLRGCSAGATSSSTSCGTDVWAERILNFLSDTVPARQGGRHSFAPSPEPPWKGTVSRSAATLPAEALCIHSFDTGVSPPEALLSSLAHARASLPFLSS